MEDLYNDDVKALLEKEQKPKTFEEAKNQALAEFKPKYDASKTMYENGKDIAQTIGISEALKDDEFLGEIKEGAKESIRTDMDTDQKNAEIKNQEAFYKKHQPVLEFARMKEPCSLALMKWTYGFAVIPFMFAMIIGELFNLIKSCALITFNHFFHISFRHFIFFCSFHIHLIHSFHNVVQNFLFTYIVLI